MKSWVRKTLSVGVLAVGALLLAPGAAQAGGPPDNSGTFAVLNGIQLSVPVTICGNSVALAGLADSGAACANVESDRDRRVRGHGHGIKGDSGHRGHGHGGNHDDDGPAGDKRYGEPSRGIKSVTEAGRADGLNRSLSSAGGVKSLGAPGR